MTTQEEFQYYIENCTKSPNSFRNYHGGLEAFVDERLSQLVPNYGGIYSYTSSETVGKFVSILEGDKVFSDRDNSSKAKRMYSNALSSYLNFLKAREFFRQSEAESENNNLLVSSTPLQQIYYGAPGTGKSHEIKELTKGKEVIRTTFHPDSDYSTFVGAYKPTTEEVTLRDLSGHIVIEKGQPVKEERIVYGFVQQAFLQAYTNAWKFYSEAGEGETPKVQYLVIEEINRGNCAQIFGDIFQLLDRKDSGFSEYPIKADNDMKKQLAKTFAGLDIPQREAINALYDGDDIVQQVLDGDVLLLPNNLFIWATMNTSDQSLFPIDSAFKRRWDWKYMPIHNADKKWSIVVNGAEYDWWQFLENVNGYIGSTTNSEDKKLGYFFCRPKDGKIDAETFVGKVCFYLWNDVFKDYGFDGTLFQTADGSTFTFDKFYNPDNSINEDNVVRFLENVKKLGKSSDSELSDSSQ